MPGAEGWVFQKCFKLITKMEEGYIHIILCANCAHPSGTLKFFLLEDEDGNTREFEGIKNAKKWVKENPSNLLAYVILCVNDLDYLS